MQDKHTIENEALATYERFVAQRDRVDSGEISWADLAGRHPNAGRWWTATVW